MQRINDDVLQTILSYLHGAEALPLTLTSKRISYYATKRVASLAICATPSALLRLRDYLLRSSTPHAGDLKLLAIDFQEGPSDDREYRESVQALTEVLNAAHNLRALRMPACLESYLTEASLRVALGNKERLEQLSLGTVNDSTVRTISERLRSRLHFLELFYYARNGTSVDHGQPISFLPLLMLLARQSRLQALYLHNFRPTDTLAQAYEHVYAQALHIPQQFSSLHTLLLKDSSARTLGLVLLFPGLRDLEIVPPPPPGNVPADALPQAQLGMALPPWMVAQGWPRLNRLRISSVDDEPMITGRLNTAQRLEIAHRFAIGPLTHSNQAMTQTGRLDNLLRASRPRELSLWIEIRPGTYWQGFQTALGHISNSLRMLELRLAMSPDPAAETALNWQGQLLNALNGLHLYHLRVVIDRPVPGRTPSNIEQKEGDAYRGQNLVGLLQRIHGQRRTWRLIEIAWKRLGRSEPQEEDVDRPVVDARGQEAFWDDDLSGYYYHCWWKHTDGAVIGYRPLSKGVVEQVLRGNDRA
ncbi:hypothetical protein BV20DRAFT_794789 [Pilatotrama ljubarskyi]|nr:hypothetical protein BV20DRAFT_794789 [Pilatotrama ljubarskyi]